MTIYGKPCKGVLKIICLPIMTSQCSGCVQPRSGKFVNKANVHNTRAFPNTAGKILSSTSCSFVHEPFISVMMCSVFGCTTKDGCEWSLHKYPKSALVRSAWIAAAGRNYFKPTKCSVICSRHFSSSAFTMDPELAMQCGFKRATLRPDAVPTINCPSSEQLKRHTVGRIQVLSM